MLVILLFIAALFLAYSNGANDNFKGVATLFGSKTTNYKTALRWATVTTFAGSIGSVLLAQTLVETFSGKGLVPDALTASPAFLTAVGFGAALTVILATFKGFPISTTHAITGALVGAGFAAVGTDLHVAVLGSKFLLPLIFSPLLAVTLSSLAYLFFRFWRRRLGVDEQWVLYVDHGRTLKPAPATTPVGESAFQALPPTAARPARPPGSSEEYVRHYSGRVLGIPVQTMLDRAHFLSAGLVSFARGLNDTPKIAALLLVAGGLNLQWGFAAVGVAMALGGLLNARRVAHTMSNRITTMNHGQGFTANLVTGFLVIVASRLGMPVSTTHVSVGALSGVGLVTKQANRSVLSSIFLSWVLTLPIAAALSGGIYWLVS